MARAARDVRPANHGVRPVQSMKPARSLAGAVRSSRRMLGSATGRDGRQHPRRSRGGAPPKRRRRRPNEERRGRRRGRPPVPPDDTPPPERQSDLADPDSVLMRRSDAQEYRQAYNAQAVVCEASMAVYEAAMFRRSEAAAADAHRLLALCLDDRAPFGLIDFFTGSPGRPRNDRESVGSTYPRSLEARST